MVLFGNTMAEGIMDVFGDGLAVVNTDLFKTATGAVVEPIILRVVRSLCGHRQAPMVARNKRLMGMAILAIRRQAAVIMPGKPPLRSLLYGRFAIQCLYQAACKRDRSS